MPLVILAIYILFTIVIGGILTATGIVAFSAFSQTGIAIPSVIFVIIVCILYLVKSTWENNQ